MSRQPTGGRHDPMDAWTNRIPRFLRRWAERLRTHRAVILAVAAIVFGLVLGFVSLIPDITAAGTATLAETLPPFSERNETVGIRAGLAELRLDVGSCAIVATALSDVEFAEFQDSGRRPLPQLDCARRIATFSHSIRLIIVENRGGVDGPYEISVRFYEVRSPRSPLAFGAFPLILGGVTFFILRSLRRGLSRVEPRRKTE